MAGDALQIIVRAAVCVWRPDNTGRHAWTGVASRLETYTETVTGGRHDIAGLMGQTRKLLWIGFGGLPRRWESKRIRPLKRRCWSARQLLPLEIVHPRGEAWDQMTRDVIHGSGVI